ncbi:GyrI-like domain-containing protein [Paenibacillus sabuli]|nr:GyrI-like domain-containing protein [Paenibacillus sabuli]
MDDYDAADNTMNYWVAAEREGTTPEGFERVTVSAAKWAVFEVRGPMPDAMVETWKRIFSKWFPSNPYEQAEGPTLEVYPDPDPFGPDAYSEIWIPLK